jgi:hypothetical protein
MKFADVSTRMKWHVSGLSKIGERTEKNREILLYAGKMKQNIESKIS